MSRRQIAEHTWYEECPICGKRITARTTVVLRQLMDQHFHACRAEHVKKINDRKAEQAQGDLFAEPKM